MHIPFVGTSLNLLSSLQILENDLVDTAHVLCIVGKKASEMWNMHKQFSHVQLNCRRPRLTVSKFYWFTLKIKIKKKKKITTSLYFFFFFLISHGKSLDCIVRIVTNFPITTVKKKKSRELESVIVATTWKEKNLILQKEGALQNIHHLWWWGIQYN